MLPAKSTGGPEDVQEGPSLAWGVRTLPGLSYPESSGNYSLSAVSAENLAIKPPLLRASPDTDKTGGFPKSINFTKLNHNFQPKSKSWNFLEAKVKVQST